MSAAPHFRTHWSWAQHLERLGVLDPKHARCVDSSSGGCVALERQPQDAGGQP